MGLHVPVCLAKGREFARGRESIQLDRYMYIYIERERETHTERGFALGFPNGGLRKERRRKAPGFIREASGPEDECAQLTM